MSINKVMLIGNVGRDPEVKHLDGGQNRVVANFTLATSEKYKDRGGNVQENTEWHNISVWGAQAEVVEKYVRKGTQLYVEGRLSTRKYTDRQGVEKYVTEVNANNIQLLGRRDPDSQSRTEYQAPRPGQTEDSPF